MKNRTDSFVKENALLSQGDKIIVGFSGGADSVSLLHYLVKSGYSVVACHLNHELRGGESDRDEIFCRDFAEKLGVPFEARHADIKALAENEGVSEEEAGRKARYDFFEEMRILHGADKIATAHTLSDNIETVVFNLLRGTGLNGLCGIPAVRGNVVRPLLTSCREDIEEYCRENGLSFVIDSTNLKDDYTRNKIRHQIVPKLCEINEGFPQSFLRMNDILKEENRFMDEQAKDIFRELFKDGALHVKKLKLFDKAIRRRVIAEFLKEHKKKADFYTVDKIENMLFLEKGKINVSRDAFLELRSEKLFCYSKEDISKSCSFLLEDGKIVDFAGTLYKVSVIERKNTEEARKINKMLLYLELDYDKIKGKAFLRTKKDGDKLCCLKRGGTKSLKKIFIEQKLGESEKAQRAVISDDVSPIALFGYDIAPRVAADENTKRILRIEKLEKRGKI